MKKRTVLTVLLALAALGAAYAQGDDGNNGRSVDQSWADEIMTTGKAGAIETGREVISGNGNGAASRGYSNDGVRAADLFMFGNVKIIKTGGEMEESSSSTGNGVSVGQNLAANQVEINKRTFTIGTSTYDADYNVIFNQWYRGHKDAEEAKPGEDLSWINDFTRTFTLAFKEGSLAVGGNDLGIVKIISFSRSGGTRNAFGEMGTLNFEQWLVYDTKTNKLIGAQLSYNTYNVYIFVKPDFFDMPEFAFPLKVNRTNTPVSTINDNGLISYKNVYEVDVRSGAWQSIYQVSAEIARKLKEADDYAKTMRRDIPSLLGELRK